MQAVNNSSVAAIDIFKEGGAKGRFLCLLAAPKVLLVFEQLTPMYLLLLQAQMHA
ncbi:MAG: hypothetical protein ACI80S_002147 [Pseudohongiellaceae bacterium]|jgi:hypothetical protein